jgi:hypothetical protein
MGWTPWKISYASNYFDRLHELAIQLIKAGKAFVCHQVCLFVCGCVARGGGYSSLMMCDVLSWVSEKHMKGHPAHQGRQRLCVPPGRCWGGFCFLGEGRGAVDCMVCFCVV